MELNKLSYSTCWPFALSKALVISVVLTLNVTTYGPLAQELLHSHEKMSLLAKFL